MPCRERGMALVTILLLLAVLLIMATVFSDKVLRATRETALGGAREQALQAAAAGIEGARHRLAASYRGTAGWATLLAAAPPGGDGYPAAPAMEFLVGGVPVGIYLRDNPDGDGNPRRDNDLRLFVLACARPALGPELRIESLCVLAPDGDGTGYRQAGNDPRHSGRSAGDGPDNLRAAPVSTFHLHD